MKAGNETENKRNCSGVSLRDCGIRYTSELIQKSRVQRVLRQCRTFSWYNITTNPEPDERLSNCLRALDRMAGVFM